MGMCNKQSDLSIEDDPGGFLCFYEWNKNYFHIFTINILITSQYFILKCTCQYDYYIIPH